MYKGFEIKLGYGCDFRIKYRFYSVEEGGISQTPLQGVRFDFWYDSIDHATARPFVIWPEFEDENGNIILENEKHVLVSGTARMWIIMPPMRIYHRERIKVGTRGYFLEDRNIAECEVIEICNLNSNPI